MFFLLLKTSLSQWWSDEMSSIFYLLRTVLGTIIWSILEKVPWGAGKKLYSFLLGWNVLSISVRSIWSITSVTFNVSLFNLCFHGLSIDESGVLKAPTIIVWSTKCTLSFSRLFLLWMCHPCIWCIDIQNWVKSVFPHPFWKLLGESCFYSA